MATLVLDTFTGPTGPLAAHTGEIGATWSRVDMPDFSGHSNIDRVVLDGTGAMVPDGWNSVASVYPSGAAGLTDEGHITEIDFVFNDGVGPFIGFLGGPGGTYFLNFYIENSGPNTVSAEVFRKLAGEVSAYIGAFDVACLRDVVHTLRIEVTPVTKTIRLDGAVVLSFEDNGLTSGYPWVLLNGCIGGETGEVAFKVDRFEVFTSSTPIFWTANIAATETTL